VKSVLQGGQERSPILKQLIGLNQIKAFVDLLRGILESELLQISGKKLD
jgi:hypothetical protein